MFYPACQKKFFYTTPPRESENARLLFSIQKSHVNFILRKCVTFLNKKMRKAKNNRYYVYTDSKTNAKYFHNVVTNQCTWFPPSDSIFLDPYTMKNVEINIEEIEKKKSELSKDLHLVQETTKIKQTKKRKCTSIRRGSSVSEMYDNVPCSPIAPKKSLLTRRSTLLNNFAQKEKGPLAPQIPIYLPQSITTDRKDYDIRKFAIDNFNTRTRGSIFKKKQIPPDELLVFGEDTSILPILKKTPQPLTKKCVEMFNLVLDYCKQKPNAQPFVLADMLNKEHELIDEAFIILFKLTRNNPSEEDANRVWDLILTVCTFFPPSKILQPFVRHMIAVEALGTKGINSIAKIAYIRLAARCDCDEIGAMQPKNWVNLIPTHTYQDTFIFGAPLLEFIYAQRRTAPKCTIPLLMNKFVHELFQAGANKVEGTFRLPGNKLQIDLMVEGLHNGIDVFKNAELRDLASLFKKWLGDLPEPIVPMCMYDELVNALNTNKIMEFIEKLPVVNHDTLGFLVGFLQEFVKSADVTLMGIIPVSMIFGANVVRIVSNDPLTMKQMTDNGKNFMIHLIENWDTSFIYPLPIEFLPA